MESQATYNPDRRPLPNGWVQHYEPEKEMWYYVQIAVGPPTVSFNHPADLIGTVNRARSSTAAGPQFPNQTMRHSPNGHTTSSSRNSQSMTVAQKLYASSGAAAAPMINTNSITSLSTSVDAASTPSPPPTSNRVSMLSTPTSTSPLRSDSSRPMSYLPQSRSIVQGTRMNPQNNNRPGVALYASARDSSVDVLYPSNNRGDHNPHRAATEPAFPMPPNTMNTVNERSHSQSVGSVDPNLYSCIPRSRPTPHLVTKARAPPLNTDAPPSRVDSATSPPLPLNLQPTSPPSTSLLFSKPAENLSLASHNRPGSSPSPITPHSGHTYNHFGLTQQNHQQGRVDATLTTAGGIDPPTLLAMLKAALSVNPIAESELRAVSYAQPNANYQGVVNALKHQQRYRPVTSTQVQPHSGVEVYHHPGLGAVDHQLLITEVGRLQIKATLAQQTQQQALIAQQQQMTLDALKKQQEAALAQQQQSILHQHAQEQALLNSHLQQQQNTTLTQQQVLLHQQAQEQAMLKLQMQQQQQAAFSQQQVALHQQAQEQALLKLQIQQQHQAAQQQAILNQQAEEQAALNLQLQQQALVQANQQQLYALQQQQATHQQLLAQQSVPVNHSHPHQPTPSAHQWGQQQQQQQQQSGLGTFMNSVMGGGPQQQADGQGNPSVQQRVVSHLFDSVMNSFQGPGASDPTASCATSSGDAGNQVLLDSITQGFNGFNGGSGQDPSSGISGLFGGTGNLDIGSTMVPGNTTLTASMDFSTGIDLSSFSSDDC